MTSVTEMQLVNPGQSLRTDLLGKTPVSKAVDVIQPNGELQLPASLGTTRLNDAAITKLSNGESTMYVFGEITYKDVFDKFHSTRFCMFVFRDLKTLNSCDKYNEAN